MQIKNLTLSMLTVLLFTGTQTALADKGGMKADRHAQQVEQDHVDEEMNEDAGKHDKGDKGDKGDKKEHDDAKGLEKQRMKKAEQERKETGKGSEQGQQMREEHSRKWWKFWE